MHSKKECREKFSRFLKGLKKGNKVAVLFHGDTDGVMSAVIIAKAIERLRGKKPEVFLPLVYEKRNLPPAIISRLKEKKVDHVLLLDWNVDQSPEDIKKLERFASLLILDHHKIYHDLSSRKTVFIKAHYLSQKQPSRYPASKMSFDLASKMVYLKDLDWVAATGILGDNGLDAWQGFVKKVLKKYKMGSKARQSALAELNKIVNGVEALDKKKLKQCFDVFFAAEKPRDVLKSRLKGYADRLDREISQWVEKVESKAEFFPEAGLVFYKIKSKRYIKSAIINRISNERYPHKTVIVVLDEGKKTLKFSARRQDFKVKMNELLEKAVKGLKAASAGGHIPAAAGMIQRKDLNRLKQNIINILEKGTAG